MYFAGGVYHFMVGMHFVCESRQETYQYFIRCFTIDHFHPAKTCEILCEPPKLSSVLVSFSRSRSWVWYAWNRDNPHTGVYCTIVTKHNMGPWSHYVLPWNRVMNSMASDDAVPDALY